MRLTAMAGVGAATVLLLSGCGTDGEELSQEEFGLTECAG